jgi:hypothetical protein
LGEGIFGFRLGGRNDISEVASEGEKILPMTETANGGISSGNVLFSSPQPFLTGREFSLEAADIAALIAAITGLLTL